MGASLIAPLMASGVGSSSTFQDFSNSDNSGGSSSGWLSGLGDLFAGIGQGVGAGIAGSNIQKLPVAGSGWQYNPATGLYVNPVTGQSLTATGTIPSVAGLGASLGGSGMTLILLAVVAFLVLRK
jgi:hypothetical protein